MAFDDSLLTALLDALDEPVLIVGEGRTLAANHAARDLFGAGIAGNDVRIAVRHPLALEAILAARRAELDLVGIGGLDRPWRLTVEPLGDGRLMARFGDRSDALAAERMRTDFVANASHELRTPLATISGYAETLEESGPLDDEMRTSFAATIRGEAGRMLRIIEDLMSLSRIEADRFRTPDELVDLAELARAAAANGEPLAARRQCTIAVEADPALTPVRGDPAQLLQLLDNLVANALRYGCDDGGCLVTIAVAPEPRGGARLTVSDTGVGIAAEHLPRLTQRFYRVDAARGRDSGGTGLGLAIVKNIVERHRGQLTIDSSPGVGTTVTVRLP